MHRTARMLKLADNDDSKVSQCPLFYETKKKMGAINFEMLRGRIPLKLSRNRFFDFYFFRKGIVF